MIRLSARALERYPLPLASIIAVAAAVFIIAVWEPIQQRGLSEATRAETLPQAAWLHASFTTSDGSTTSLASSNGHPRIVTMMYAHCPGICPMSIATLGRIESQLSATERNKLQVVALTLNPEQDSLAALQEFRQAHRIDSARWTLGRPSSTSVASLAEGLGITYRVMSDGTVDHQSQFALLDADGQIIGRTSNTRNPDPQFVAQVRRALEK